MSEFAIKDRTSECVLYNTQIEVTVQVNEYLLRDRRTQNTERFGKIIIVFN